MSHTACVVVKLCSLPNRKQETGPLEKNVFDFNDV